MRVRVCERDRGRKTEGVRERETGREITRQKEREGETERGREEEGGRDGLAIQHSGPAVFERSLGVCVHTRVQTRSSHKYKPK